MTQTRDAGGIRGAGQAGPREADLRLARSLAGRLVAAGAGRICRVAMVGSRANGTAHATSDLDVVALIETPSSEGRWTAQQVLAEKHRLMAAVGPPPLQTDLWLRTTDQYAEAQGVPGGMEHVLATTGLDVYSRPLTRAPVVRRTPGEVRRDNVRDWLEDALADLRRALSLGAAGRPASGAALMGGDPADRAGRSVKRAFVAACVWHGAELPGKSQSTAEALSLVEAADAPLAALLSPALGSGGVDARTAAFVFLTVAERLRAIEALRRPVAVLLEQARNLRIG